MTVALVIIGHNAMARIPSLHIDAANAHAQGLAQPVANAVCSPVCDYATRVVVNIKGALTYDNTSAAKPAELFVLNFGQRADAEAWLQSVDPLHLAGKSIYLMDTSSGPAASAATP